MSVLEISLLGAFQATIGKRPLTGFRSDKVRALLIYLAAESERPHRRETLAGLLWPDFSQKAALSNLRKTLYHLRRTIDKASPGFSDKLLTITRQAIQVVPEHLSVDSYRYQENLAFIKQHRHQHLYSCGACLERLKTAADLYQGEFAFGFSLSDAPTFESWLLIQREYARQETLFALEHLAASYEMSGDYEQARLYANRQIMMEPWRENAYRQLMRVLVMDGRRSEALAQYEICRQMLWEELEVEPAAETRQLFEQIKNGKFVPAESKTRTQLHHFPTQFTPFIGRGTELAEITSQITQDDRRLLTLIGPGGIGKTRLSIEAARQLAKNGHFKDGIYFVPLAAITEGDYFLMSLANQLDISIYGRNQLRQSLQNYLSDKDVLLVLDNFEQLTAESGLISQLLLATKKLKILVSSREALNIRVEQRLLIGGMTNESAVNLFLQAAAKVWPAYIPEEQEYDSIREICRLIVEIPLAVEMAAGWVKTLDVASIAGHIKSNFDILQAPFDELPERHRSMRIVFEESWKLLNQAEQKALAQFSIFKGSFSLYAALEITDATINEVATLLDKSLISYPGKSRYQLHELLRQFAQSKLDETSNAATRDVLQRQFAQHYLDLVQRNESHLYGKAPQFGMEDIKSEIENILHAWDLAIQNDQLELVAKGLDGLKMYFRISGRFQEAYNHFSSTIDALAANEKNKWKDKLLCRLLVIAADFAMQIGEFNQAEELLEKAFGISNQENWLDTLAEVEQAKGDLYYKRSKFIHANAILQKAISYFDSVGNQIKLAESYYRLGICFRHSERWQDAAQILTKALNLAQSLEYNWAVVVCLWALGFLYRDNGRLDLSLEYHEKSIQLAMDINFLPGVYRGYISSGHIYEDLGNYDKAIECYELSIKYAQETGDKSGLARSNGCIGRVLWKLNRIREALEIMNETLPVLRQFDFKVHIAWQLIVKAEILFSLGRYQEAWPVNEEGLRLARETSLTDRIIQSQVLRARLLVALGQKETAVHQLNEMLDTAEEVFTLAAAHYELWQITKEKKHSVLALSNYRRAYEIEPYIEYKERVEILEGLN